MKPTFASLQRECASIVAASYPKAVVQHDRDFPDGVPSDDLLLDIVFGEAIQAAYKNTGYASCFFHDGFTAGLRAAAILMDDSVNAGAAIRSELEKLRREYVASGERLAERASNAEPQKSEAAFYAAMNKSCDAMNETVAGIREVLGLPPDLRVAGRASNHG
jgi:hypothetical protein